MKEREICDAYGYTTSLGYDSEKGIYFDGVVFPSNGSVELPITFPFNKIPKKEQNVNDFVSKRIRVRIEILED